MYPRISIVTPSYNQGHYIEETIESVLNQGYPNLEYIVIDGGSKDNSINVIRKYEKHITYWCSEPDNGQSDALRKGFSLCTGDIMGWLNSDDIYFPSALFRVADAYRHQPHASIYIGGVAVGELNNGPIRTVSLPPPRWTWLIGHGQYLVLQQGSFYSRHIYEKIGGINPDIFIRMDGDLMHRLLLENSDVAIINHVLGFIRWHDETKSSKSKDVYTSEIRTWHEEIGLTAWRKLVIPQLFRMLRAISGSYTSSWIATQSYQGRYPKEIWLQHKNQV